MEIRSFEDLECWKLCREIRKDIYNIVQTFPAEEKYGLSDDMKRAARSTTHNIAEGYGRFHYKDNMKFCYHSRGSLFELIDQLITAIDCAYIDESDYMKISEKIASAIKVLNGYINYLDKRANEKS